MAPVNATRKEMRRAIRSFGEEINKGAVGLFYYAGHGIQVDGENYLVPVSAEVYTEAEVEDECLKVSSVLRQMESAGNRLNIIILDACRDNPFGRSFRSSNTGLAKMDAPTGSILAYATAPGSIAIDGTGSNGLYTSILLKHMMTPNLVIEKIFKRVRIDVVNASGKRQTPWESSSLMGDFYFNLKRGINVEGRTVTESESSEQEPPKYAALHPDDSMPYKLAIFPWRLDFQRTYSRGFVMSIIIPSLNNTIDETKLFTPLFSYYEIDEEFSSKMISKDILGIDSVWEKKSFFSNYKPNINIISEIGKQLNIDAVLMFDMLITLKDDFIRAYLIDVKKKKIYYAYGVTYIFREGGGP